MVVVGFGFIIERINLHGKHILPGTVEDVIKIDPDSAAKFGNLDILGFDLLGCPRLARSRINSLLHQPHLNLRWHSAFTNLAGLQHRFDFKWLIGIRSLPNVDFVDRQVFGRIRIAGTNHVNRQIQGGGSLRQFDRVFAAVVLPVADQQNGRSSRRIVQRFLQRLPDVGAQSRRRRVPAA